MEGAIYLLCAVTALTCSLLLLRGYRTRRVRLLLWCGLFFLALTAENVFHFVDVVLVPQADLSLLRAGVSLAGMLLLLYGFIWEVK